MSEGHEAAGREFLMKASRGFGDRERVRVSGPQRRERILVVDDIAVSRLVVQSILTENGYDVDLAENGGAAIKLVRSFPYDLILMDMHMSVMDGVEATKIIRSLRGAGCEVPIVAIAATPLSTEVWDAGMDDYVIKPVKREHLLLMVRRWVGGGPLKPMEGLAPN